MEVLLNIANPEIYLSGEPWFEFLLRFFANCLSLFILIRFIYYPHNGQARFLFIFFLTGLMIFLISSTLDQVTLNIGIALGLFAIFGILRFRTPPVELKEMTYLFISIGMAVINGLVEFNVANWFGLFVANVIILGTALIMERYHPNVIVLKKTLVYSPSDINIVSNKYRLKDDIQKATGIDAFKVDIIKINKTKNEVTAWVYFRSTKETEDLVVEEKEVIEVQEESDSYNEGPWNTTFSNDY